MTKTRRWLSLLVAACLTLSLLPAGAVADENAQEGSSSMSEAALNLGAGVIQTGDTIYFGTNSGTAVSWSVLSTNGNDGSYEDSKDSPVKSSDALFLLSDTAWGQTAFGSNNTYSSSSLRTALLGYVNTNYFTTLEQAAILKTSKADGTTTLNGINYSDAALSDDTLFALSAAELKEYLGYDESSSNTWTAGLNGANWWLRSAISDYQDLAGVVYANGRPYINYVNDDAVWARPAFNLNLNSVLFTSAAEGGKSGAEGAGALKSVSTTDNYSAWKLTLKDSSREFAVGTVTVNGNSLTVSYSGATTGDNEYISAIVVDESNNITYYGRIKSIANSDDASGTVNITLPSGFNSATDTLYLFSERYNTDNSTDYASELQEVALYSVTNSLINIETSNSNELCSTTSDYTATLSASEGYSLPDSITVTAGGTTLIAGTDYTYNSSTGELTIYVSAISGNIVITAQAVSATTSSPSTGIGGSESDGSTTDTTGSEGDSSTTGTTGSEGDSSTTGTTVSSTASTSSDTSTLSASSDSSLPQTGDTSTALLLGTVATLGLSAPVIALSLAQRRRCRIQGAHVRRM